MENERPRN